MGLFSKLFGGKQVKNVWQNNDISYLYYPIRDKLGIEQAKLLIEKAESGDVDSEILLADIFLDDDEPTKAFQWYEKAAALGSAKAYYELIEFYEGGFCDIEADPIKARQAWEKALELNYPQVYIKLGQRYFYGDDVEENKEKAFEYYKKAAELGNEEGIAHVGACFFNGDGVEQNFDEAFKWFSVSKDEYYSPYYLAQCYLNGLGTKKDIEKSVYYLERAYKLKGFRFEKVRKQLIELYDQGYGGFDSENKLNSIKADRDRSDKLFDDLFESLEKEGPHFT